MATSLSVVVPIFAVVLIGWLARRVGLVDPSAFRALREVVFYLAMPAFLFSSIVNGPPAGFLLVSAVYFAACLGIFVLALGLGRLLGLGIARAAMLALNASFGNTVMIGIPVTHSALGPDALPPVLAIIALHSAILLPLAVVLIEAEEGASRRGPLAVAGGIFVGTFRNPVILAILLAFAWRATGFPVPTLAGGALGLIGPAATPMALLCLGGTLPAPSRAILSAEVMLALALKLVGLPVLVWLVGSSVGLSPLPLAVAVLTAAMPTGANAFLLAHRNERLLEASAATVLISTLLSVATIGVLVRWLA